MSAHVTFEFTIQKRDWLSANDRLHWAEKARRTRVLRAHAHMLALNSDPLGTSHVAAFIGYPRNGKADPANAAPTVKALIDGITDAGVFPGDDSTCVVGQSFHRGEKCPAGQHTVRLVITSQEIPF